MGQSGMPGSLKVLVGLFLLAGLITIGVLVVPRSPAPADPANTPAESDSAEIDTQTDEAVPEPVAQIREPFEPGVLLVGDPAPSISASRWYHGEPTEQLEIGRVHVVDLWATWCGPCVRAMPHLSGLQEQYANQGLRVIAVSIDKGDGAEAQVERFIERRAEDIGFDVALDDGGTNSAWLDASGRTTIPTSFVVDREGTVVWVGNPLSQEEGSDEPAIDRVLREVFDGSYDVESAIESARSEIIAAREAEAAQARIGELTSQMGKLWGEGKLDEALAIIDQLTEIDPEGSAELAVRKAEVLLAEQNRPAEASAYFESLIDGPYFDDNDTLIRLANLFSGSIDPGELGREAAVTAASLVASRPGVDPDTILVLAKAQFAAGEQAAAVKSAIWARDFFEYGTPEYGYYNQYVLEYERTD